MIQTYSRRLEFLRRFKYLFKPCPSDKYLFHENSVPKTLQPTPQPSLRLNGGHQSYINTLIIAAIIIMALITWSFFKCCYLAVSIQCLVHAYILMHTSTFSTDYTWILLFYAEVYYNPWITLLSILNPRNESLKPKLIGLYIMNALLALLVEKLWSRGASH